MTIAIEVPASKSLTQRALIIAALADEPTRIDQPLDCDDARHLCRLLGAMGTTIRWDADAIEVTPGPLKAPREPIFCGNAGTTVRFGAALAAVAEGTLCLDGDEHMRRRPMGPLSSALASLGVAVHFDGDEGHLPARFLRQGPASRHTQVDASLSSQFASGLLLVAPRLEHGLVVELTGDLVSRPYLEMTAAMMRRAGVSVSQEGERSFRVVPGSYRGGQKCIEADWSAAAFLLAASRITGLALDLPGLTGDSLQGDAAFSSMLALLDEPPVGPHYAIDLTDTPDLIAPLTAVCLFADHPTRIRGAAHTRIKESDRVAVLAGELDKIGARIVAHPDGLDIAPLSRPVSGKKLDPHGDHRMAMAFGVISLRVPLEISDRSCVGKSFPRFWEALAAISAAIR